MGFTPEQERFLKHNPRKHGRLVAGPGAGKSYTCVAYMEMHSNPEIDFPTLMKMLTFTRAAAREFADTMKEQGLGEGAPAPSTVHAFALSILRKTQWPRVPQPVRIAGSWERKNLIHPQLARMLTRNGHVGATPSKVSKLEDEMAAGFQALDPNYVLLSNKDEALRNAFRGAWEEHRNRVGYLLLSELPRRAGDAVDDVGLPSLGLELLLVDEYQDLNKAEIRLISLAAREGITVVAIGDEDQSIYGDRLAAPQGIRDFPNEFGIVADCDYRFTLSRRCGTAILSAAQTLIEQAPDRAKCERMQALDKSNEGVVGYLRFPNMSQESNGITRIVQSRLDAGVAARKIAVLVRTKVDTWAKELKPAFDAAGIPIASADWVKDALADPSLLWLRAMAQLSLDIDDSLAWMTLMKLERGIGIGSVMSIYDDVKREENFARALRRIIEKDNDVLSTADLAKVKAVMALVAGTVPKFALPEATADDQGAGSVPVPDWGAWLIERAGPPLSDEVRRLLTMLGEKSERQSLAGFLGDIEPYGKERALSDQDAVRFMTIKSSKGLTFDTVIIVGVENGLIPFPKGDPAEERRMLYVAMTRATDMCILTLCTKRRGQLAYGGTGDKKKRSRSALTEGVIDPQDAVAWLAGHGIS